MQAIRFRFYPTLAQRRQLSIEFKIKRLVWNWALQTRSEAYKADKTSLNAVALSRMLTQLKVSTPFLKQGSVTVSTYTLKDLDEAFGKFFSKQAKYPKKKKFGTVNSARYQIDKRRGKSIFIDGELLKLPKLGPCKVKWSKSILVIPNSAIVSKAPNGKWYISLQYETEDRIYPPSTDNVIGLDFGLITLITTSKGEKINGLKPFKKARRKLAMAQRRLSKTQKGSANRNKLKQRVACIHNKISNQRKDAQHKLSTSIVTRYAAIGIEDLNVSGMLKNRHLSRAIADCGFYELRRQLIYKSKWYGRTLVLYPRFDRSTGVCPDCGIIGHKLPLNVRSWICKCGKVHDRDQAAAKVIELYTAGKAGIKAPGSAHKLNDNGSIRENRGRDERGKAQFTSLDVCGQM